MTPTSGKTVTVTLTASAESGDTAESPADFTAQSHMLTFNPGDVRLQTTVRTVNDAIVEPDETFTVTLSNATNAMISGATATVTITNDDTAASTCTLNTGDIWCGVVTPASYLVDGVAFAHGFVDGTPDTGALSDKEFSVVTDGVTNSYTIVAVALGVGNATGSLSFSLTSGLTAADEAKLVLHVDGSSDQFRVQREW